MAQTKKSERKALILETAQSLFLEKGYENSSIRVIADRANLTPSNIYNYFEHKESIFEALVQDLYQSLMDFFERENSAYSTSVADYSEELTEITEMLIEKLILHEKILLLLVLNSHGTKYENFLEEFRDAYIKHEVRARNQKKSSDLLLSERISDNLLEGICDMYLNLCVKYLKYDLESSVLRNEVRMLNEFVIRGLKSQSIL